MSELIKVHFLVWYVKPKYFRLEAYIDKHLDKFDYMKYIR